jgi:DNA-binding XRE family transcriptional regulator
MLPARAPASRLVLSDAASLADAPFFPEIPTTVRRRSLTQHRPFLPLLLEFWVDLPVAFGKVLRRCRKRVGMSQEVLGFESELERNYVSMLELGQRVPSLTTVVKLAGPLGMPAWELIRDVDAEMENDLSTYDDRKTQTE